MLEEELERERDRDYLQLQTRDRDYREFRATNAAAAADHAPEGKSDVDGEGEGAASGATKVVPVVGEGVGVGEASLPARRTEDAERGTEGLVEALDIAEQFIAETRLFHEAKTGTLPQPEVHPLMRARRTSDPYRFVLLTLSSIRSGLVFLINLKIVYNNKYTDLKYCVCTIYNTYCLYNFRVPAFGNLCPH